MELLTFLSKLVLLLLALVAASLAGVGLRQRADRARLSLHEARRQQQLELDLAANRRASDRLMAKALAGNLTTTESDEFKKLLAMQGELREQLQSLTAPTLAHTA